MPRKAPWPPPIVQRGGKDSIRLRLGPGKYREVTLGPTGSELARAEYTRILAEIEAHGRPVDAGQELTVNGLAVRYLEVAKEEKDSRDYVRARRAFRVVCKLYGHKPAREFGPLAMKTCRDQWVKEDLSRRYINKLANAVRAAWRWAVAQELIAPERAAALAMLAGLRKRKSKAREKPDVRPADLAQVDATLPHLPPALAALVRLQLLTGCRPGEALALRPCDLVRPWKVVDGVELWLYKLDEHKTDWRGFHRWIPIGPRAQGVLRPYLDRPAEAYCFSPREVAGEGFLPHGAGKRYTTASYDQAIRKACRRAFPPPEHRRRKREKGRPKGGWEPKAEWLARIGPAGEAELKAWRAAHHWAPNQLRHSRATEIETTYGREDARCVLGHRTPSMTAVYAESVDRAGNVMAKIG